MITKFSLKKPMTIFVAVILIIVLGIVSFTNMQTDLLPSMEMPYVVVATVYAGAPPEKVEVAVTKPLESTLATVGGVEEVASTSSENMSLVILQFTYDTNMDSIMVDLNNKISSVTASFDDMVSAPIVMQINPDMLPVMISSVSREGADLQELTDIAEKTVVPALEQVTGVASVSAQGSLVHSVDITMNQEKIDHLNEKIVGYSDQATADALKQINDGKRAIAEAKKKIDDTKNKTSAELVEAGIAINDGKTAIQVGISAIDTAVQQAELFSGILDPVLEKLTSVQSQIDLDQYTQEAADSCKEIAALLQKTEESTARILKVLEAQDPSQISWEELKSAFSFSSSVVNAIDALQKQMVDNFGKSGKMTTAVRMIDEKLIQLQDVLLQVSSGLETAELNQNLSDLTGQIQALKDQITSGVADLPEQKKNLQATLESLTENQKQVEQGKILLSTEISNGLLTISQQEQALAAGEAQIQTAVETATKKAGLGSLFTTSTLQALLTAQNFSMPAGYLMDDTGKYAIKIGDQITDLSELENLPIFASEIEEIGTICFKDVADVTLYDNSETRFAKVNGEDGIIISIQKQSTASTSDVSKRLKEAIEKLESKNEGLSLATMMDQGVYIKMVINTVLESLLYGGILAIFVLLLFLRNLKPTIVVALSIPISLTLAIALMYFTGVGINIISLAGLALGVGMLVDNSIVVIENTYRLRAMGVPAGKAALEGAKQVAGAITASTLTTVCVFLPIVFTNGMSRQLFTDMGLTIAYSLLASLLVALSLVPVLSATLLKNLKKPPVEKKLVIKEGYGKLLSFCLKQKWIPILLAVSLLALSIFGATRMGTAFIPDSVSDQMNLTVTLKDEEEVNEKALQQAALDVMNAIKDTQDLESVGVFQSSSTGATSMLSSGSGNSMTLYICLTEKKTRNVDETLKELKEKAASVEGCETVLESSMNLISYLGSGVQITFKGTDLSVLKSLAQQAGKILEDTEGLRDVNTGLDADNYEVHIQVDKEKAVKNNLTVAQVYQSVATVIQNSVSATSLETENETISVNLCKSEDQQITLEALKDYEISYTNNLTGADGKVKLNEIAKITTEPAMSSIRHNNFVRTATVSAAVEDGYNVGLISREIGKPLSEIQLPDGYTMEMDGENELINSTMKDLALMLLLAILMVYLIMVAQFQSLTGPFVVMFTIPLAFTGGLLALWAFGFELSVISILGFLVLSGVVVNNGIVFVDTANQLQKQGVARRDALIETGKMRLRPIFMTAITTILGLTSLALGIGTGADMLQPMAVTIVFGLLYATLLTLFIVPVLCDGILMKKPMREIVIEDADAPEEFSEVSE